jgi:hypothetical protein
LSYLFLAIKVTKLKLFSFLNKYRERFDSVDKEFKYLKKMIYKVLEPFGLDTESEIRDPKKKHPGPGSGSRNKKALDPEFGSATLMFPK